MPRTLSKLKAIRISISARLCKEPIPLCQVQGIRTWLFLFADLRECFLRSPLGHQLVLVKQIDRLLDEGGLIVFQVQTEFLQPLGMAIADPALQPAVGFLLAFHVLALPLGIVLRHIHLYFLAHMTLLTKSSWFVISHSIRQDETLPCQG